MIRKELLPGLTLVAIVVAVAFMIESLVTRFTPIVISPLVVSVVLGAVMSNIGIIPAICSSGIRFAARTLLRLGIVLLGLQLSFSQMQELGATALLLVLVVVSVTFFGTQWIGRRMGLTPGLSLLVATGFSICGASAIAAMRPVSGADDDETAYAIALVTICGSLAIFILPFVAHLIGFDGIRFGSWVGASVHDVAQTVATASTGNEDAQHAAIIVKLTRVVLLAPLVVGVSIAHSRRSDAVKTRNELDTAQSSLPPLIPLFVVGFLAAITINSLFNLPEVVLSNTKLIEKSLLGAALVGLGAAVDIRKLRLIGVRPLALGLLSWILIAALSGVGVAVLNIG